MAFSKALKCYNKTVKVEAISREHEHGAHAEWKNYAILLVAMLTSILTKKSNAWPGGPHLGQIPHCMEQNWLVRVRVSQYALFSWLFHKQLQLNPNNSNSDNLNSPLTRTKSNFTLDFTPLLSHFYLVNFIWDILNSLLTWTKLNFLWSKIHWNLLQ